MLSPFTYTLVTPERIVASGEAEAISVMTSQGEITVLPHHVPLLTLMRAGEMRVRLRGEETIFATSTGMFEVREGGQVVILADTAEHSDELELGAIEAAKKRAEEEMQRARKANDVGYADAVVHLERELARYRVALKKQRRKGTITSAT